MPSSACAPRDDATSALEDESTKTLQLLRQQVAELRAALGLQSQQQHNQQQENTLALELLMLQVVELKAEGGLKASSSKPSCKANKGSS